MKSFLVIGLGRFGRAVACELGSLGHEVLALDNSEENVQHIADSVTQAVCGDAQDESVLTSLGVRNFDCCVVAIGTDIEASILVTVMLKELGAKQVVCKALSALHARCSSAWARTASFSRRRRSGSGSRSISAARTSSTTSAFRTISLFWRSKRRAAGSENDRTARRAREVRHQRSGHPARRRRRDGCNAGGGRPHQ